DDLVQPNLGPGGGHGARLLPAGDGAARHSALPGPDALPGVMTAAKDHDDGAIRIRRYCVTPAIRRSKNLTSGGAGRSSGSVINSGSTRSTTRPRVSTEQERAARTFCTHCTPEPYVRKKTYESSLPKRLTGVR